MILFQTFRILIASLFILVPSLAGATSAYREEAQLFLLPQVSEKMQVAVISLKAKQVTRAQKILTEISNSYPWYWEAPYLLTSLYASQGKTQDALRALDKAIAAGFDNHTLLYKDQSLASLRDNKEFNLRVEKLIQKRTPVKDQKLQPSAIQKQLAPVTSANTHWDPRVAALKSYFKFNSRKVASAQVQKQDDLAAKELNSLFQRGLAAGNTGDLYDNRDRKHSSLSQKQYPQLAFTQYSKIAVENDIDYGLNTKILYNAPTFGNTSTAVSSGPFWRSQARLAYTLPNGPRQLALQYLNNHLYIFPAVGDYTKEKDLLPANTPYLLISEGKSGSDQPFMRAVSSILAAFKPAEKDELIKSAKLIPAIQMIFRKGQKNAVNLANYFTSKSHPAVFTAGQIDLVKMIRLANNLDASEFPSVVQMRVLEENQPIPGIDDFTLSLPETLFNTPAAIARVIRSSAFLKTMKIQVKSVNKGFNEKIEYKWVLLQGDAAKISIKKSTADGSTVEITSKWHTSFEPRNRKGATSNRVEIAVFAVTDKSVSAPSFVTLLYPENQKREYSAQGKILSIDHTYNAREYVDPQIFAKRNWRDDYRYDDQGRLLGWSRSQGAKTTEFTYHGAQVIETDPAGRATKAQRVGYIYDRGATGHLEAKEKPINAYLSIEYINNEDMRGIITKQ